MIELNNGMVEMIKVEVGELLLRCTAIATELPLEKAGKILLKFRMPSLSTPPGAFHSNSMPVDKSGHPHA